MFSLNSILTLRKAGSNCVSVFLCLIILQLDSISSKVNVLRRCIFSINKGKKMPILACHHLLSYQKGSS